ncbi:MAG: RNA-binding protein [Thermodesulfobacteriota bacterium]
MSMNLYVGNLSFGTTETDLQEMFAQFGQVESAKIIMDRDTGRSRGFGFVEMANREEGEQAIASLNGKEIDSRRIKVNEARPRQGGGKSGGGYGGSRGGGWK